MHQLDRHPHASWIPATVAGLLLIGCKTPAKELERVAKDWCLNIRASQVLPVYPLTEDLQPGDVFLVSTPISRQTEVYDERGFLALDQQVTRLEGLDYARYYRTGYWSGSYAPGPGGHDRPSQGDAKVTAPRVAFPSYTFDVDRSVGLALAIPIQGVPVGLGLMDAQRATGSVSLDDAYTYAVDGEDAYDALLRWWDGMPRSTDVDRAAGRDEKEALARGADAQQPAAPPGSASASARQLQRSLVSAALGRIAAQSSDAVYLRVVTRVFLVREVTVSLANLDSSGGGGDVGVPQSIQLPDLSLLSPDEAESAASAYAKTLEALSGSYNDINAGPGVSFRFTQVGRRSVTLADSFDRPLVLGYLGFDVKVYPDGRLSAPIPSFSVLNDGPQQFTPVTLDRYEWYTEWMEVAQNRARIEKWLADNGHSIDPADLLDPKQAALFDRATRELEVFTAASELSHQKP